MLPSTPPQPIVINAKRSLPAAPPVPSPEPSDDEGGSPNVLRTGALFTSFFLTYAAEALGGEGPRRCNRSPTPALTVLGLLSFAASSEGWNPWAKVRCPPSLLQLPLSSPSLAPSPPSVFLFFPPPPTSGTLPLCLCASRLHVSPFLPSIHSLL